MIPFAWFFANRPIQHLESAIRPHESRTHCTRAGDKILGKDYRRYTAWCSASACVAPFAEMVARTLWSTIRKQVHHHRPATRLTQFCRREARAILSAAPLVPQPRTQSYCRECGIEIGRGRTWCANCANVQNTEGLIKAAQRGRVAAQSSLAQSRRSETQRNHVAAKACWESSYLPDWLNEEVYLREIQPRLKSITLSMLASKLGISIPYAVDVRSGRRVLHPRHWQSLAQLVGVSHA